MTLSTAICSVGASILYFRTRVSLTMTSNFIFMFLFFEPMPVLNHRHQAAVVKCHSTESRFVNEHPQPVPKFRVPDPVFKPRISANATFHSRLFVANSATLLLRLCLIAFLTSKPPYPSVINFSSSIPSALATFMIFFSFAPSISTKSPM
jgi:hypothetical protein